MNIPYQVKVHGVIKGNYIHNEENREQRRKKLQKDRFYGESKNFHLSIHKTVKCRRRRQFIKLKSGSIKVIEHYDYNY